MSSETKEQVFEALLIKCWMIAVIGGGDIKKEDLFSSWRKRYEKAERFGRSHDVDDLYEEEPQEPK